MPFGGGSLLRTGDSTGVIGGFTGDTDIPAPPTGGIGVYARAASNSDLALRVQGKAKFSRSGRTSFSTSTKTVSLSGVSSSSFVVATLQSSVSGVYVRAVVPATGSFKIYLSKSPGKTVTVGCIVFEKP